VAANLAGAEVACLCSGFFAPFFDTVDIAPMTENYTFKASSGQAGADVPLSRDDIETLLRDVRYKNDFTLAVYIMRAIIERFAALRKIAGGLINQIERELEDRIE
jgi:hypothetical protein